MNPNPTESTIDTPPRKTWDLLVRTGHWLLAAAFVTAWIAGDDYQQVHVLAGYTIVGILLVRIAWGVIGPRNARFAEFVRGPRAVLRYLRSLWRGDPEEHRGHNPAGGWMIVLLLVALTMQVSSGMTLYALEEGEGPLAGWLVTAEAGSHADEDRHDEYESGDHEGSENEHGEDAFEEAVEEIHEFGADFLLILVALHITGVVVSSVLHRQNYVRGMITGQRTPWRKTGTS